MARFVRMLAACGVVVCCVWLVQAAVRTWRASQDIAAAQARALSGGEASARTYLQQAAQYRPDDAQAWRLQAEFRSFANPVQALAYARRAVGLDPDDWRNWDRLGLIEYQLGDSPAANRALAQAVRRDSGWEAHYQLGSLALLLGQRREFWREMKAALAVVGPAQAPPVLREAWSQTQGHPQRLLSILARQRTALDAQAAGLVMDRGWPLAAAAFWRQVQCPRYRRGDCRAAVLGLTNKLVRLAFAGSYPGWSPPAKQPPPEPGALARAAIGIWNQAVSQGDIRASPAHVGSVGDGRFAHPWIGPAFAWFKSGPVYLSREAGAAPRGAALRIAFDGYQPGRTPLISQIIPVAPGAAYRISYDSRRQAPGVETGLALAVMRAPGVAIGEVPAQLRTSWTNSQAVVRVPQGVHLILLAFQYQRPEGQVRMHNPVLVADVRMREVSR